MTVQGCETLIYNGDEYRTNSEPLKQYLEIKNITFAHPHTGCWRGYYGDWLIEDDNLYLIGLKAWIEISNIPRRIKEVGLDYIFPNQEKVFAEWFSGDISLPNGKPIQIPRYCHIPEQSLILNFVCGKLVGIHIKDNTHFYQDALSKKELPF